MKWAGREAGLDPPYVLVQGASHESLISDREYARAVAGAI
jgi:hypothetical protein